MRVLATTLVWAICVVGSQPAAAGETCWSFESDPGIAFDTNDDGSRTFYFPMGVTYDDFDEVRFRILLTGGAAGSFGHSSQIGPLPALGSSSDPRVVVEYDEHGVPTLFLGTVAGGGGAFVVGDFGVVYEARIAISPGEATLTLIDESAGTTVLLDTLPFNPSSFNLFQVCYDYFSGTTGYCEWDAVNERIAFRSDRLVGADLYYVEGWVDDICVSLHGTPVEENSWGELKESFSGR